MSAEARQASRQAGAPNIFAEMKRRAQELQPTFLGTGRISELWVDSVAAGVKVAILEGDL